VTGPATLRKSHCWNAADLAVSQDGVLIEYLRSAHSIEHGPCAPLEAIVSWYKGADCRSWHEIFSRVRAVSEVQPESRSGPLRAEHASFASAPFGTQVAS